MCKVSVIVPVYNTEKYLRACLNSLAAQTLKDFEVIIVNDGSTDDSLSIAEEFAAYHSNFKLFSIENNGVSHARNYGAEMSHGDYLAFVDSDDEVEPDYCKAMYQKAILDGNDVVICGRDKAVLQNGTVEWIVHSSLLWDIDNFRLIDHPELLTKMSTGPWNKLVKRELFFNVCFQEDLEFLEDVSFTVRLLCLAERIGVIKSILYHYFGKTHDGTTSRFNSNRLDCVLCLKQLKNFIEGNGWSNIFRFEFEYLCISIIMSNNTAIINKPEPSTWEARLRFICEAQAFLKKSYPHWRQNPYYQEATSKKAKQFRLSYYNYGETHMLLLLYLSHLLPKILYKQVLHVDHVLVYICRYVRWGLFGSIRKKR